ncbi:MAG: hypothetical protein AB7O37_20830 [Vicinamibacteria bacterium]
MEDAADCRGRGFDVVGDGAEAVRLVARGQFFAKGTRTLDRLPAPLASAARRLGHHVLRESLVLGLPRAIRQASGQIENARSIVARQAPSVVILAEDNVEYGTAALIRAAHERQTKVLILPFTIATAREPAESYRDNREHQVAGWLRRRFARSHPQWVYELEGRALLRLPLVQALALERLGLAPARPWTLNSGSADHLAVESPAMMEHYLREGLPADRLVMTGALSDDVLAAGLAQASERREALYREAGLPPGRPLLLCALPPDQHGRGRSSPFASFDDLVRFWLDAVATDPTWNVVVVPHPRSRDVVGRFSLRPGVALLSRDTADLVPLCDVFVAAVSATIRWALACAKPVVNFDVYRYGYEDYADQPEVVTLDQPSEFAGAIRAARERSRRAPDLARASRWGRLDGRSGERLLRLLDSMSRPSAANSL